MSRKFSLAHLTVIGCAPPEMVRLAADCGYDYVSLRFIPLHTPGEPSYLPDDKAMLRETRAAIEATGVKMLDLELARILADVDPKSYEPAMAAAAELGAKHVLSSAWTASREDRGYITETYGKICDLAAQYGLTVELEFPSFSRLTNLAEAVEIVRGADRANGGILVDMLYIHFSRVALAELSVLPPQWFHLAHLCDGPSEIPTTRDRLTYYAREDRSYVGEGGIDIAAILKTMPPVPCSIELPNAARVRELGYAGHARRCLETARQYFERNGL